jgi:hypothetical protein
MFSSEDAPGTIRAVFVSTPELATRLKSPRFSLSFLQLRRVRLVLLPWNVYTNIYPAPGSLDTKGTAQTRVQYRSHHFTEDAKNPSRINPKDGLLLRGENSGSHMALLPWSCPILPAMFQCHPLCRSIRPDSWRSRRTDSFWQVP